VIDSVDVTAHGESLEPLLGTIKKQALADLLSPHFTSRLNVINVDDFARQRGIKTGQTADLAINAITDSVTIRIKTRDGEHTIVGEVFLDGRPRIMAINGYQMNLVPEGQMVLIFNHDEPGVIGLVGNIFGDEKVNIADMMLSRQEDTALMVLKIDGDLSQSALDKLSSHKPPINRVLPVTLPPIRA
jgi:D-3-phosphoglycerate dehydrogenase